MNLSEWQQSSSPFGPRQATWRAWPGVCYRCFLLLTIFTSPPWFQAFSDWHTRIFTIWHFGSYVDLVLAIVIFVLYYWVLFGVKTLHLQVTINFAIQFRWQVHFLQYYVSLLRQQIIMVLNSCNKFLLQIFYFWASCRFSVLAFLFLKTVKNIINNISILKYIF